MLRGLADFWQRTKRFAGSWYFLPAALGLASVPVIFGLILWLPMGWWPGDWPSCPQNTESGKVRDPPDKPTVFAWLQCGPEDGESNSTTLRNVGLLVAGFYALIFAFWRAKIADAEKNLNIRGNRSNQGSTSDLASDTKWTGANFANADLSGSNFKEANFGWNIPGGRDIGGCQDGDEQGDCRDSKYQEIDDTLDPAGNPNGEQEYQTP